MSCVVRQKDENGCVALSKMLTEIMIKVARAQTGWTRGRVRRRLRLEMRMVRPQGVMNS